MKVILLRDVPNIGHKYQVVNVADGYALNFLLPKGLAENASEKAVKRAETLLNQEVAEKKIKEDLLVKNLKDLEGVTVTMSGKANEKGHLFAGIHIAELIPVIKEQTRLDVDAHHIILEKPIKEVGEHKIDIKVQDKKATFTLVVEATK